MRTIYLIIILLCFNFSLSAQGVYEYSIDRELTFKVYTDKESKLYKIENDEEFQQNTPEELAQTYFFGTSNEIVSKLYLDKTKYKDKDNTAFEIIKKTPSTDVYIKLLHKTNYNFEGNEMAYVMFIARIKNIKFPFPTLLSLIKKDNKWFINKRPNQKKLTDCLMMLKPCILSNLIDGESEDLDVKELLSKTKSESGSIDFMKVFDELVLLKNNDKVFNKLTMSKDMNCNFLSFKQKVKGKNYLTGILKNTSIKKYKKQDENIISLIRKNNDSIVLTSRLDVEYSDKKYTSIKYIKVKKNGEVVKESIRLDNNKNLENPVKEILFLFDKLNSKTFFELTPSLNKKAISESEIYIKSRGLYEVLNITKLFNLFKSKEKLFSEYISE